MDRIAIISDIHGNIPALEAVLDDIRQRGIECIYCLGDLVGKGPNSDCAVDMCREICTVVVRGNWDSAVSDQSSYQYSEHILWHRQQLGEERLDYLRNLPNLIDFRLSGKQIRLYHASHISEWHRIFTYETYETHLGMFANTAFTGEEHPEPDVVGYGDIHVAFMMNLHRHHKTLFNAGSVGNPLDIPMATYAVLSGTLDGEQPAPFLLDFIRLPYDMEQAIEQAARSKMPDLQPYIFELQTGIHRDRQPRND